MDEAAIVRFELLDADSSHGSLLDASQAELLGLCRLVCRLWNDAGVQTCWRRWLALTPPLEAPHEDLDPNTPMLMARCRDFVDCPHLGPEEVHGLRGGACPPLPFLSSLPHPTHPPTPTPTPARLSPGAALLLRQVEVELEAVLQQSAGLILEPRDELLPYASRSRVT